MQGDANHNERRAGMVELTNEIKAIRVYLEYEFGGKGLNGHEVEGNVNRQFRELREEMNNLAQKVQIQNGRVSKLELWQARVFGAIGVIGCVFSLMTLLVNVLKH